MIGTLFQILGSLGVFLFGMKVMSEGIQKFSGGSLRKLMATMTKNRFLGLISGLVITCLVQSSSATTVMVVSFVNARLLTLTESIGIIMGANLGTTTTFWLVSYFGVLGKFSLTKMALPIIGIGLPMIFSGRDRLKALGETFIGFGILFMGLGLLKNSVPDVKGLLLSNNPDDLVRVAHIQDFITQLNGFGFFSVLIFIFVGVILTLLVQSSSAAGAITITVVAAGWIDFQIAAAIILGENIGTTVTAYLASMGASTTAKRSARAHFLFNIIGVLWMLVLFYPFVHMVDDFWPGSVYVENVTPEEISAFKAKMGDEPIPEGMTIEKLIVDQNTPMHMALFHTGFNFANIILLIGFVPLIARIVERWVKDEDGGKSTGLVGYESSMLPELSELKVTRAEQEVFHYFNGAEDFVDRVVNSLTVTAEERKKHFKTLKKIGENGNKLSVEISEYLLRCSSSTLSANSSAEISRLLRITAELEDIYDCCDRIASTGKRRAKNDIEMSQDQLSACREHATSVMKFLKYASQFVNKRITQSAYDEGEQMKRDLNRNLKALKNSAIGRMEGGAPVASEVLFLDVMNNLQKSTSHCFEILDIFAQELEG